MSPPLLTLLVIIPGALFREPPEPPTIETKNHKEFSSHTANVLRLKSIGAGGIHDVH